MQNDFNFYTELLTIWFTIVNLYVRFNCFQDNELMILVNKLDR